MEIQRADRSALQMVKRGAEVGGISFDSCYKSADGDWRAHRGGC